MTPSHDRIQISTTPRFQQTFAHLSKQAQRLVDKKIALLACNPSHPSLHAHRHRRSGPQMWECYLSLNLRLLYQIQQSTLLLCEVGSHAIVERHRA